MYPFRYFFFSRSPLITLHESREERERGRNVISFTFCFTNWNKELYKPNDVSVPLCCTRYPSVGACRFLLPATQTHGRSRRISEWQHRVDLSNRTEQSLSLGKENLSLLFPPLRRGLLLSQLPGDEKQDLLLLYTLYCTLPLSPSPFSCKQTKTHCLSLCFFVRIPAGDRGNSYGFQNRNRYVNMEILLIPKSQQSASLSYPSFPECMPLHFSQTSDPDYH